MVIYLPSGPHGEKVGVDDFFAAGNSIDDLLALATDEVRRPAAEDRERPSMPYRATAGGLVWNKVTQHGIIETPLANFTSLITSDITEDDGAERHHIFEIDADLAGRHSVLTVPTTQFASMSWPIDQLGAGAIVYPGNGLKDHARAAIQMLSGEVPRREVYAHTGWRHIGGEWIYLHAGGGITRNGTNPAYEVRLSDPLSRIALPDVPDGDDLRRAVEASVAILSVAPIAVSAPVVAMPGLAPLIELLTANRPDFVPWLHGPTGAFKSELAALAQGHFGDFTRLTLPATFMATANAIERLSFSAKDALLVVDDYHPAHDRKEEQAMAAVAARLLRGAGNGAGRQRMRPDTSIRQPLPPRAMILATGERLPPGHSTAARMFPVAVARGDVDLELLSELQARRQEFPKAMAGYIRWIAQNMDGLEQTLVARFGELRVRAQTSGGHPREPGQVAHLQLGLETYLQFASDVGAITSEAAAAALARAWDALLGLASDHARDLSGESPTRLFLALLTEGIASKHGYLEAMVGGPPDRADDWGWELAERYTPSGEQVLEHRHRPAATLLGHLDDDWLYLIPSVAHGFVAAGARQSDQQFPADLETLLRRLVDDGLIAVENRSGRRTVNVRFGSQTRRVIKLRRSAVDSLSSSQMREQGEHGEQMPFADSPVPSGCSPSGSARGNKTREHADSETDDVPSVPSVAPVCASGEEDEREVMEL